MEDQTGWRFPWRLFWAEFVGTATLLWRSSPVAAWRNESRWPSYIISIPIIVA